MADRDEALRTIFHEYVHLVIDNVSEGMPLWLNEGLAEYDSTFQVEDSGRRALVGRAIPSHLQLLNHAAAAVDSRAARRRADSSWPTTRASARRSSTRSRGRSCTCSSPAGRTARPLLSQYGRLASDGTPSLEAWQQVFKDETCHASARTLRPAGGDEAAHLPLRSDIPAGQELLVGGVRRRRRRRCSAIF